MDKNNSNKKLKAAESNLEHVHLSQSVDSNVDHKHLSGEGIDRWKCCDAIHHIQS